MESKRELLEAYYPGAEIEVFETGHAKINGETAYVISPKKAQLSIRHELISDLAATGMKPVDIARHVKTNPGKSDGGHYARLLRDPRLRARAEGQLGTVVNEAKDILTSSVVNAANNIKTSVLAGDLGSSKYVLGVAGISEAANKSSQSSVTVNFGQWLSAHINTKTMHSDAISTEAIEITNDASELPSTITGERL